MTRLPLVLGISLLLTGCAARTPHVHLADVIEGVDLEFRWNDQARQCTVAAVDHVSRYDTRWYELGPVAAKWCGK